MITLCLAGDDADLFASGSAPSASQGMDDFPDFGESLPPPPPHQAISLTHGSLLLIPSSFIFSLTPVPPPIYSSTDAPPARTPAAPVKSSSPKGISAFPSLDSPGIGGAEIRVTGVAGTGQDEEREKFESAFPDLSGEMGSDAVSRLSLPDRRYGRTSWTILADKV